MKANSKELQFHTMKVLWRPLLTLYEGELDGFEEECLAEGVHGGVCGHGQPVAPEHGAPPDAPLELGGLLHGGHEGQQVQGLLEVQFGGPSVVTVRVQLWDTTVLILPKYYYLILPKYYYLILPIYTLLPKYTLLPYITYILLPYYLILPKYYYIIPCIT